MRFAIIGELLTAPPQRGELREALQRLADKHWQDPAGKTHKFSFSTIERWYYRAAKSEAPTEVLRRKTRKDAGSRRALGAGLLSELESLYRTYPDWSYKLHSDNLVALVAERPELGPAPSYATVRRRMQDNGWRKRRRARTRGQLRAAQRLEEREVRSYEMPDADACWHYDFHVGSKPIVTADGEVVKPVCLCIIDDCTRLICHIQWYLSECAESLAHGLIQAFLKRGLPRKILSDNGSAMIAAETRQAMSDLSVMDKTTLAASPYQNGKQETLWDRLEGRLVAMLSRTEGLQMDFLNRATLAWAEMEYNRTVHDELSCAPVDKYCQTNSVGRPAPDIDTLRFYFTRVRTRRPRRSDATISVEGVRYEIPASMRHFNELTVRYAIWDLSHVFIVDPRANRTQLATVYPVDKAANADGRRACLDIEPKPAQLDPKDPVPPLLRKLLSDYAATGLPPAYIPHTPAKDNNDA